MVGFAFNPLKVKLLAGDLRAAQNLSGKQQVPELLCRPVHSIGGEELRLLASILGERPAPRSLRTSHVGLSLRPWGFLEGMVPGLQTVKGG